jgi:hypothetical protein
MAIKLSKSSPMPAEYYRRQAARVRTLAHDATTLAIREHLTDVARQYDELAQGTEGELPRSRIIQSYIR